MENLVILYGISILFLLVLYRYLTMTFDFWKKRGIPGPKPVLIFGTMKDNILKKVFIGKFIKDIYDAYENTPFIGLFHMRTPVLMIKDPQIIKDVLIKDSTIFCDRETESCLKAEPLRQFMFFNNGLVAQLLKKKISLVFTPSKLKDMFHLLLKSLERWDNYLEELLLEDNCVNCNDLTERLTVDMINSCLIGINMNTLTKVNEENIFLNFSKQVRGANLTGIIKDVMMDVVPQLYDLIGYYLFNIKKITEFFTDLTINIMEQKKKYNSENNIDSKYDFVSLLNEMRENPGRLAEITEVTDQFISAQLFGFFLAGHETSYVAITNTLYELALNHNIQDKLREEIQNIYNKSEKLQYEDINNMLYLDAVFKETLRKYPVSILRRQSTSSYTFKGTKITVPKNQDIIIPLYAIHHDPKIYPNPEVYDPERFTAQALKSRDPILYIPFGYGPRYCIGERLGIFQVKLALISFLRKYKVDVCQKTITSYVFHTVPLVPVPDKPIFLKITKL